MTVVLPGLGVLTLVGFSPAIDSGIHINDVILGTGYSPTPNDVRLGNNLEPATSAVVTLVSPGVCALALAGLAPSTAVSNNQFAVPDVGALTVVGLAPSVVLGTVSYPSVGSLVVAGVAPAVVLGTVVYPAVGAVTLAGLAPSVAIDLSVRPDVGVLTLTGLAPTVDATQNATVTPDVGLLTLAGFAPDAQGDPVSLVPGGGFMQALRRPKRASVTVWTYEGFAPTVTVTPPRFHAVPRARPVVVPCGTGALSLIGYAPSVSATVDSLSPTLDFADVRSGGSVPVSRTAVRTPDSYAVPAVVVSEAGPLADEEPPESARVSPSVGQYLPTDTIAAATPLPVAVSPLTGQLALTAFAPSVDIYGAPWSPEEDNPFDDEAFLLVALDYMEMV